jgi:hypothetical protein
MLAGGFEGDDLSLSWIGNPDATARPNGETSWLD